jgi:hypothetical protein
MFFDKSEQSLTGKEMAIRLNTLDSTNIRYSKNSGKRTDMRLEKHKRARKKGVSTGEYIIMFAV